MRQALRAAIVVCAGPSEVAHMLEQFDSVAIPSKTSLSRFRFWGDVAIMLRTAQLNDELGTDIVRFLMVDASTQHGIEVLMSCYTSIKHDDLARAVLALDTLVSLGSVPVEFRDDATNSVISAHTNVLVRVFRKHVLPPVVLGLGACDLAHKLQALCHQIWLETSGVHAYSKFVASIHAFTGDLGAEAGLADAPAWTLQEMLPYCSSSCIQDDRGGEDVSSMDSPHRFTNAVFFAGLQHIVGNVTESMCQIISGFDRWYDDVRVLAACLHRKDWLSFIQDKLFGVEPLRSKFAWLFNASCPKLADWRWQTLIRVLNHILPRILPLRLVWNSAAVASANIRGLGVDDAAVAHLSACIENPFYWAYGRMLWHVQSILEDTIGWLDTCPCHRALPQERGASTRKRRRRASTVGVDCPCVGMFAPMIAAGELQDMVRRRFEEIQVGDLLADTISLPQNERGIVFADFEVCRTHVHFQLAIKLHFTTVIPMLCCGVMHPDEHVARCIAQECLKQYDSSLPGTAHHRLSENLLSPAGVVRRDLEKFAQGHPRSSWSDATIKHVTPLKFISVNERPVEATHAVLKARGGRKLNKQMSYLSFQLRFPDVRQLVETDGRELRTFTQQLETLQAQPSSIPVLLGLGDHPMLRANHSSQPAVKKIVYHYDGESMLRDLDTYRKRLDQARAARKGLVVAECMRDPEPLVDALLRRAAWRHIREVVPSGAYITLPAAPVALNLDSLASRLAPTRAGDAALALCGVRHASPMVIDSDEGGCLQVLHEPDRIEARDVPRVYKVVRSTPGRQICIKPVPGVSRWLEEQDVAVTQHHVHFFDGQAKKLHVHVEANSRTDSCVDFALLRCDEPGSAEFLRRHCLAWQQSHDIEFTTPLETRVLDSDVRLAVSSLLAAGALPNSAFPYVVSHEDVGMAFHLAVLHELHEKGVARKLREGEDHSTWELTAYGVSILRLVVMLQNPVAALTPRCSVPLREWTTWELVDHLQDNGWVIDASWGSRKPPSPFALGQPKSLYIKAEWINIPRLRAPSS